MLAASSLNSVLDESLVLNHLSKCWIKVLEFSTYYEALFRNSFEGSGAPVLKSPKSDVFH